MKTELTLIESLEHILQAKNLVHSGQKILLAVSGGVDSVVMFHLFLGLREAWNLTIAIAHVNHQLRGNESLEDEDFVRLLAQSKAVPFYCERVDTLGLMDSLRLSKQEAAREARYKYFEEIRRQLSFDSVATAHQADDNAETVLMNIVRGTGIRGLAGIPLVREKGCIIRPLLFARRNDILAFAANQGIQFRTDSSNASMDYTRNYLRYNIIPLMESEFGQDVTAPVNRISDSMKAFVALLNTLVEERLTRMVGFTKDGCNLTISELEKEPGFLQEEILLSILRRLGIEPRAVKIRDILLLCSRQTGHSVQPSGRFTVHRDRNHLVFSACEKKNGLLSQVTLGSSYEFPSFRFSLGEPESIPSHFPNDRLTEYVDGDKLEKPLSLRNWNQGDWFVPLGMRDRKKLSDFFNDVKISRPGKNEIPLLESNKKIVWVCGQRLDDRFKITPGTRHVIKLSYTPVTNTAN